MSTPLEQGATQRTRRRFLRQLPFANRRFVIQISVCMTPFFTRERFGRPQIYAVLLLLALIAQCLWLMAQVPLTPMEMAYVDAGQAQWRGERLAGDAERSPLVPLIAAAPVMAGGGLNGESAASTSRGDNPAADGNSRPWRARLPFLVMGVLLGASVWYVARRLYGNTGGYIALALYSFSPVLVSCSARVRPEIAAAWGAFGAVFTGIAVSHTLYAPREVVLWNWRRILLLGVALAFAVGAQFSLMVIIPLTLVFMLYLVPGRRGAAVAILAAACGIAFLLICACYFFRMPVLMEQLGRARLAEFVPSVFGQLVTWRLLGLFFFRVPGVLVLLLMGVITYLAWPRTRFFGTAAPLIACTVLIVLGMGMPHVGGYTFLVVTLPFACVFIAGVFADLLETRASGLVLGLLLGVVLSQALFSILGLARLHRF